MRWNDLNCIAFALFYKSLFAVAVCHDRMPNVFCNETVMKKFANGTCLNTVTHRVVGLWNVTAANENHIVRHSASSEYFKSVLHKSGDFQTFSFYSNQFFDKVTFAAEFHSNGFVFPL